MTTNDDAGSDLEPMRAIAAELLAAGVRVGAVAKQLGVARQQIWLWGKTDDAFAGALARARAHHVERVRCEASEVLGEALATVRRLLKSADESVQLSAAKFLLGLHLPKPERAVSIVASHNNDPQDAEARAWLRSLESEE